MDMQALNCNVAKSMDHDSFGMSLSPSPLDIPASSYIGLPQVSPDSLDEIHNKVTAAYPSQKEVFASIVLDKVCACLTLTNSVYMSVCLHATSL